MGKRLKEGPRAGCRNLIMHNYWCRQLHANYYGNSIDEKKHKNMQSSMICSTHAGFFTPPKGMTNKHIRTRAFPTRRMLFPSVPFSLLGVFLQNEEELIQSEMVHGTIRVDFIALRDTSGQQERAWLA
jgi:hypothetical protein